MVEREMRGVRESSTKRKREAWLERKAHKARYAERVKKTNEYQRDRGKIISEREREKSED